MIKDEMANCNAPSISGLLTPGKPAPSSPTRGAHFEPAAATDSKTELTPFKILQKNHENEMAKKSDKLWRFAVIKEQLEIIDATSRELLSLQIDKTLVNQLTADLEELRNLPQITALCDQFSQLDLASSTPHFSEYSGWLGQLTSPTEQLRPWIYRQETGNTLIESALNYDNAFTDYIITHISSPFSLDPTDINKMSGLDNSAISNSTINADERQEPERMNFEDFESSFDAKREVDRVRQTIKLVSTDTVNIVKNAITGVGVIAAEVKTLKNQIRTVADTANEANKRSKDNNLEIMNINARMDNMEKLNSKDYAANFPPISNLPGHSNLRPLGAASSMPALALSNLELAASGNFEEMKEPSPASSVEFLGITPGDSQPAGSVSSEPSSSSNNQPPKTLANFNTINGMANINRTPRQILVERAEMARQPPPFDYTNAWEMDKDEKERIISEVPASKRTISYTGAETENWPSHFPRTEENIRIRNKLAAHGRKIRIGNFDAVDYVSWEDHLCGQDDIYYKMRSDVLFLMVEEFMREYLHMSPQLIGHVKIIKIVATEKMRKDKFPAELLVTFASKTHLDIVMTNVSNLPRPPNDPVEKEKWYKDPTRKYCNRAYPSQFDTRFKEFNLLAKDIRTNPRRHNIDNSQYQNRYGQVLPPKTRIEIREDSTDFTIKYAVSRDNWIDYDLNNRGNNGIVHTPLSLKNPTPANLGARPKYLQSSLKSQQQLQQLGITMDSNQLVPVDRARKRPRAEEFMDQNMRPRSQSRTGRSPERRETDIPPSKPAGEIKVTPEKDDVEATLEEENVTINIPPASNLPDISGNVNSEDDPLDLPKATSTPGSQPGNTSITSKLLAMIPLPGGATGGATGGLPPGPAAPILRPASFGFQSQPHSFNKALSKLAYPGTGGNPRNSNPGNNGKYSVSVSNIFEVLRDHHHPQGGNDDDDDDDDDIDSDVDFDNGRVDNHFFGNNFLPPNTSQLSDVSEMSVSHLSDNKTQSPSVSPPSSPSLSPQLPPVEKTPRNGSADCLPPPRSGQPTNRHSNTDLANIPPGQKTGPASAASLLNSLPNSLQPTSSAQTDPARPLSNSHKFKFNSCNKSSSQDSSEGQSQSDGEDPGQIVNFFDAIKIKISISFNNTSKLVFCELTSQSHSPIIKVLNHSLSIFPLTAKTVIWGHELTKTNSKLGSFDFNLKKPLAKNAMKFSVKCSSEKLIIKGKKGSVSNMGQISIFILRFLLTNLEDFCNKNGVKVVRKYGDGDRCRDCLASDDVLEFRCAVCHRRSCRSCYQTTTQVCKGQCGSFLIQTNNRKDERMRINPVGNTAPFYQELESYMQTMIHNNNKDTTAQQHTSQEVEAALQQYRAECPPSTPPPPHHSLLSNPPTSPLPTPPPTAPDPTIPPPPPLPPQATQTQRHTTFEELVQSVVSELPVEGKKDQPALKQIDKDNFDNLLIERISFIEGKAKTNYRENGKLKIFSSPGEIDLTKLHLMSKLQVLASWKMSYAISKEENQILRTNLNVNKSLVRKLNENLSILKSRYDELSELSDAAQTNDTARATNLHNNKHSTSDNNRQLIDKYQKATSGGSGAGLNLFSSTFNTAGSEGEADHTQNIVLNAISDQESLAMNLHNLRMRLARQNMEKLTSSTSSPSSNPSSPKGPPPL